ncbi:MAG: DUF4465 domain-containing protein, partial [Bacteroidales bacterium]|nr:DUF4465 domain-containing protein [Bacteroidales bacterium]
MLANNDACGTVSGGGTYGYGSAVTISATAYEGYRFVSWNDGNTDHPRTITVTSDSTFVANFTREGFYPQIVDFEELPLDGENSSWIGDDGSGQFTSSYLTLYNDYDSQYDAWTGFSYTNGTDTETNSPANLSSCVGHGAGNSANYVTAYIGLDWMGDHSPIPVGMKINTEIAGNFAHRGAYFCMPVYLKKYVVGTTTEHYYASHQLYFKLKASAYTTGALVGDREIMMADYTEGNSYMMDDWTYVDLSWIENADSLSFTAICNDTADGGIYTPLFFCMDNFGARNIDHTITVSANNDAYGSVSGGGTYAEGTQVLITATPYEGYRFVSWNDGNTDNPRTITVTSDSTFIANFESDSIFSTITESFEPYELGSYMSEVAAPRWELWTDGVLGGLVSDEQAHYGSQSMKVYKDGSTDTDVVLNVNDLTAGRYKVEFYMYVPVGNTGYYNILQDNDGSNSKYGIQLTFNDSIVTIDANGKQDATNTYIPESWIKIQQYIDLDNDWSELYLNDAL